MRRLSQRGLKSSREAEQPVNPMDGVANMADAMLILAVGIMLALIINWKVDISAVGYNAPVEDNYISFEEDDMQPVDGEAEPVDSGAMERLGTVYFDEATGKYYIIKGE